MKERPILFSGAMVRAILDGRKTQTRRIVKVRTRDGGGTPDEYQRPRIGSFSPAPEEYAPSQFGAMFESDNGGDLLAACPYGKPADRLWVRETWQSEHNYDDMPDWWHRVPPAWRGINSCYQIMYGADRVVVDPPTYPSTWEARRKPWFGNTNDPGETGGQWDTIPEHVNVPWRPSIHMPRWASRITLEITDVRVERIRDISVADALAEGCCVSSDRDEPTSFHNTWNACYPGSWDRNDWVWALSFKRVGV